MKHFKKSVPVKRITPADGQYFFGYYDLQPYNSDQTLHLTHKTQFRDRLQKKGDTAEIGYINIQNGKYEMLDTTQAWNFQQGAMLQWNPKAADREIIYNSFIDNEFAGVLMDIYSGKKRYLDRPVANVSKDGKYAISINMSRLYDFRPGYGYAWPTDKYYYDNHSCNDGVFVIDMESGKSKLVLSLQQIWDFSGGFFQKDEKIIINHITFNPDASRFLALVRNFSPVSNGHKTAIITAKRDGSDMYLLSDYGFQSHYWWLNNEDVVFFSDGKELDVSRGRANNYILKDKTNDGYLLADGFFEKDNHMSFTDDRKYMITDTYPDYDDRMQTLRMLNTEKNIVVDLGRFYSMPYSVVDVRCDLHPRWNRTGDGITFDSTHEGFRGIYKIDLPDHVKNSLFE